MQNAEILKETMVRMKETKNLPGEPTPDRLRYWMNNGFTKGLPPGVSVTLEWAYFMGELVTSREAFERFTRRQNGETG